MTMRELLVLVPRPGTVARQAIDVGSGVVASVPPVTTAEWLVYFEGNRFDVANMRAFSERVLHAAGRLDQQYPTIARGLFARDDFAVVGTFTYAADWREHHLTITDAETVAAWTR